MSVIKKITITFFVLTFVFTIACTSTGESIFDFGGDNDESNSGYGRVEVILDASTCTYEKNVKVYLDGTYIGTISSPGGKITEKSVSVGNHRISAEGTSNNWDINITVSENQTTQTNLTCAGQEPYVIVTTDSGSTEKLRLSNFYIHCGGAGTKYVHIVDRSCTVTTIYFEQCTQINVGNKTYCPCVSSTYKDRWEMTIYYSGKSISGWAIYASSNFDYFSGHDYETNERKVIYLKNVVKVVFYR